MKMPLKLHANLAKQEGLLVGISAGANVYVASAIAQQAENKG